MTATKIDIENVNHPSKTYSVDAGIYGLVRQAWLDVLAGGDKPLTLAEIVERLAVRLPGETFTDGAGLGWWSKTVQLDLEAKGLVKRDKGSPIRMRLAS
ncbi:hypothetical protein IHQ71_20500 [Rhizobium sp. TH2]|uniref:DUF6958 family protein n=1 Tax=Rhizobium sp. TH2 TaxID=2775403 RepID=UPI002157E3F2|nr:hypothetical protein [Rhizobium sp. TH2]UVC07562.1 hypothetical protein IHQ71_20500 [Rhizobium sp. TH2]